MRTKFRAWNRLGGNMMEVSRIDFVDSGEHWIYDGSETMFSSEEYDLMQFTGLLDKSGKEIFEGDIVKIDGVGLCRVDYLDDSMTFYFQTLEGHTEQFTAKSANIEIVGNVHENEIEK